jgi:hypothetical protein
MKHLGAFSASSGKPDLRFSQPTSNDKRRPECCQARASPNRRDQEDILAAARRRGEELEDCSRKFIQTDFLFPALRRCAAARILRLRFSTSLAAVEFCKVKKGMRIFRQDEQD